MSSQKEPFSAQGVLERLTGQPKAQDFNGQAVQINNAVTPPLYALVIGISRYLEQNSLKGAASDASLFKSYLTGDLRVPEAQITTLLNADATRDGIIKAFQGLARDSRIERDDPIVIYYAGHGAELIPPADYEVNGPLIQCLVPHDASRPGPGSKGVLPIPDFTLGSLLNKIARAHGNNITVIFDCCHSATISRMFGEGERAILRHDLCELPVDLDSDIVAEDTPVPIRTRALVSEDAISIQAMRSHVLLAACGQRERAHEDVHNPPYHGFFTTALLNILRNVGPERLTYKGCIQRFPKLKTPGSQNPTFEGVNVDRIFFNAMVSGANNSFILIEKDNNNLYLQGGTAQGITPGCTFAIHADLVLGPANPPLGTMTAIQVAPFRSLLKRLDGTPAFSVPCPGYGRQIGSGEEQVFDVFITPDFEKSTEPDPRWENAFSGGEKDVVLRLTNRDLAHLVVDVDSNQAVTFTFTKLEVAITHGATTIPYTVPTTFGAVYPVLSAAARWNWHLQRLPLVRPFQNTVTMEFYKLKASGEYDDTGEPIFLADGDNLNWRGVAQIEVNKLDYYGFNITSAATRDLYAYLFFFSASDLSITPKFTRVFGNEQIDPSLPKGVSLTIGYGSGGVTPLQFWLGMGQNLDVGVFKLFLTTSPVDFDSVRQDSPFRQSRKLVDDDEVEQAIEFESLWDATTMELVQRPGNSLTEIQLPAPYSPSQDEVAESWPDMVLPFANLSSTQQAKILQNAGGKSKIIFQPLDELGLNANAVIVGRGIHLSPNESPRQASNTVAVLLRHAAGLVSDELMVVSEDVLCENERDAQLTHAGLPPLGDTHTLPWIYARSASSIYSRPWTTRRMMISRLTLSLSPKDLLPNIDFVRAVQDALNQAQDWRKFKALQKVFATWGDVLPLHMNIGVSLVATGIASGYPQGHINLLPTCMEQSIEYLTKSSLGAETMFEQTLGTCFQGSEPMWSGDGYETWLRSTAGCRNWGGVRVTKTMSIVDLLQDDLRHQVNRLYAGLIFRSPCTGVPGVSGFDYAVQSLQEIEQVEVGFSASHVERIKILYTGEFITDIFVWPTDQQIASIQFVKNTGHVSPVYGAKEGVTQEPVLLSGNGGALGIWHRGIHADGYRRMQTSFVGGCDGVIWNDLRYCGNQSASRILSISARKPGTGILAQLQTTYTYLKDGAPCVCRSPVYGTESGQTSEWTLEEGEYITGARGRHNGRSLCELQLTSNRSGGVSPAFGQSTGNFEFEIRAPKTEEGVDMSLHYMLGKSAENVNSILFVWAEQATAPSPQLLIIGGGASS